VISKRFTNPAKSAKCAYSLRGRYHEKTNERVAKTQRDRGNPVAASGRSQL
jgi:hypothetical protein